MASGPHSPTFLPLTSPPPPPSDALLSMQRMGLELMKSPVNSRETLTRPNTSREQSTTSLDKPLPLEPRELARRSSSVYSCETTISNILELYRGSDGREGEDLSPSRIHQPQVYRNLVAPLLIKRFSSTPSESSDTVAFSFEDESLMPSPWATLKTQPQSLPNVNTHSAPTFLEFSRSLNERRMILGSPLAASPAGRQNWVTRDLSAPASSVFATDNHPRQFENPSPFSDNLQSTLSPKVGEDLMPQPLEIKTASRQVGRQHALRDPRSPEIQGSEARLHKRRSTNSWSSDSFIIYTGVGEVLKAKIKEKMKRNGKLVKKEKQRAATYGNDEDWSNAKGTRPRRGLSVRGSKASSLQQGVSDLFRALSLSTTSRSNSSKSPSTQKPRRQKQLAIPTTPYQKYGVEVWFAKNKKKRRKERQARRATTQSELMKRPNIQRLTSAGRVVESSVNNNLLVDAYHGGQNQIVNAMEVAKQKLMRSPKAKRREKLKQSIVLVGPADLNRMRESVQEMERWV